MNKDLLLKRLTLIKYLYLQGLEISKQPESIAFSSILLFHDSIEMFLKLASTYKNKKSDKLQFIQYWDTIPELTLKASMETFNKLRVNLKHHGILPSQVDLETSRVNTTDFFNQNTLLIFNISFDEVNLFNLIIYKNTKTCLIKAQEHLEKNNYNDSVEEATKAFYELLHDYKKSKSNFNSYNRFEFTEHIYFDSWGELKDISGPINDMTNKINENFKSINEALEIISFGINYKKYTKFKNLTPVAHRFDSNNYHMEVMGDRVWNKENCQFLINFVLESTIQIQEFDYDINSILPEKMIQLNFFNKKQKSD